MRAARETQRQEGPCPIYPSVLPDLRKTIVIIDHDFGKKVNVLKCYQSGRIDQYRVEVNGKPWKERIGLAGILAGIRKAMPPVRAA